MLPLQRIQGEIYEVDVRMMETLNILEGIPYHYCKLAIPVEVFETEHSERTIQDISAYLLKDFKPQLLNQQFYQNYDSYGDHGVGYIMPADRDPNGKIPFTEIKLNYVKPPNSQSAG